MLAINTRVHILSLSRKARHEACLEYSEVFTFLSTFLAASDLNYIVKICLVTTVIAKHIISFTGTMHIKYQNCILLS